MSNVTFLCCFTRYFIHYTATLLFIVVAGARVHSSYSKGVPLPSFKPSGLLVGLSLVRKILVAPSDARIVAFK